MVSAASRSGSGRVVLRYAGVAALAAFLSAIATSAHFESAASDGTGCAAAAGNPSGIDRTKRSAGSYDNSASRWGPQVSAVPRNVSVEGAMFEEAVATSRRKRDRCIAPIVCQLGAPCVATNADLADLRRCNWTLPALAPSIASVAKVALVEVGTNFEPEMATLPRREGWYSIAVDPLHAEGRQLWEAGRATVLVSAAVAPTRGSMQFAKASVMTSMAVPAENGTDSDTGSVPAAAAAAAAVGTQPAALLPLSEIMDRYVPPHVEARLLVVDAQGFDAAVTLSAGLEHLRRFRYVVIECQELWSAHPARYNPKSPNCTGAAARLETEGGLVFVGCMRNVAILEYNCLFAQRDHPVMGSAKRRDAGRLAIADMLEVGRTHGNFAQRMRPSFAARQLHHLVPDMDDASDLATIMCSAHRKLKPPDCQVFTELRALVDMPMACTLWVYMCKGRKTCLKHAMHRCLETALHHRPVM